MAAAEPRRRDDAASPTAASTAISTASVTATATKPASVTDSASAGGGGGATRPHLATYRRNALWLSAIIHRLSGLALAAFLPLHFLFLGLALQGEGRLQTAVSWTGSPLVKFAEMGLVFLLTLHLLGGLRVLVIENLAWHDSQKTAATLAVLGAASVALFYLAQIV